MRAKPYHAVAEPTASLDPGSGPSPQATGNSNQPPSTSSPNANGDPSNQDNDPNETGTSAVGNEVSIGGGVNTAAIGGAVGGGVGALLIIGGAFLLRRRNRRQKRAAAAAAAAYDPNTGSGSADGNAAEGGAGAGAGVVGGGLQEKDGAAIAAIPTSREGEELDGKALVRGYKSPIYGTTELASNAPHSPHEQYQSPVSPQERTDAELSGTPRPYGSELPGNGYAGFVRGVHEAPGSGGGGYGHEMPAQGMGYQAGPVYEMPAYSQPQAQPPPQQYQAWQGGSVAGIGRKPVGGA